MENNHALLGLLLVPVLDPFALESSASTVRRDERRDSLEFEKSERQTRGLRCPCWILSAKFLPTSPCRKR